MSAPLVTVVTPVYNGERHLGECIESVVAQTYENWEYVVVDNCSTDTTREIAERFAALDSRVRYERHDEFVDVIASFNRGFGVVSERSVYCKMLGADDWLFPECLARMVDLAERVPTVGIIGGYRLNGRHVDLDTVPYREHSQPGREVIAADVRRPPEVIGAPTALLIRAELIRMRTPFYDATFRHADTEAAYWALMRSDFGVVHQVVTYNREQASTETVSSNRIESYTPDRVRMLVRYGPQVFSADVYRLELRAQLNAYRRLLLRVVAGWHVKRRVARAVRIDGFKAYHEQALGLLAEEAGGDRDVERLVRLGRRLLARY